MGADNVIGPKEGKCMPHIVLNVKNTDRIEDVVSMMGKPRIGVIYVAPLWVVMMVAGRRADLMSDDGQYVVPPIQPIKATDGVKFGGNPPKWIFQNAASWAAGIKGTFLSAKMFLSCSDAYYPLQTLTPPEYVALDTRRSLVEFHQVMARVGASYEELIERTERFAESDIEDEQVQAAFSPVLTEDQVGLLIKSSFYRVRRRIAKHQQLTRAQQHELANDKFHQVRMELLKNFWLEKSITRDFCSDRHAKVKKLAILRNGIEMGL